MRVYDCRLLRPTHARLVDALEEATKAANAEDQLLDLDREHWHAFLAEVRPAREGHRDWARKRRAVGDAAVVGIAWWTDATARRHFRVWAEYAPDDRTPGKPLWREDDPRPPLWHLYPDRVFCRARRGREWLAACVCGECDVPERLAWMGPCCGPCHDRLLEEAPRPAELPEVPPATFPGHPGAVTLLAFSGGGRTLASAGRGRDPFRPARSQGSSVCLWDVPTGTRCGEFPTRGNPVGALAFSHDGRLLALAHADRSLRLVDPATREVRDSFVASHAVGAVAFSPDDLTLALAGPDELQLWGRAVRTAPWVARCGRPAGAGAVAFSPARDLLAVGWRAGGLTLGPAYRPEEEKACDPGPPAGYAVTWLGFTPDGRTLLSISRPGHDPLGWQDPAAGTRADFLQSWDVQTGKEKGLPLGLRGGPLALSPDGEWLAECAGPEVGLVNVPARESRARLGWDGTEKWECVAFSPDGETLATGGEYGTIKLWPWRRLLEA